MTAPSLTMALQGEIRLHVGEVLLIDRMRTDLLAQIDATGSISRAAKAIGASYKSAWDAIDAMNAAAGRPLVVRTTGGRGGGGTRLTPLGRDIVGRFNGLHVAHVAFLRQLESVATEPFGPTTAG